MKSSLSRTIIIALVVLAGIAGLAYATGAIQKPETGLEDKGDWNVQEQQIKVKSTAYIYNPNPLGLNLSTLKATYTINMNGVQLAQGQKEGLYVPKSSNKTVNFTSNLNSGNIPEWWVSHLRNGEKSRLEIPITAVMGVGPLPLSGGYTYSDKVSTDIEEELSNSVSELEGNYSRRIGPDLGIESNNVNIAVIDAEARFGYINRQYTELVIPLRIRNKNDYAIPTPQLNGNLKMNDVKITDFTANNVKTMSDTRIPPGETREITLRAQMPNRNMENWFKSHIRKKEKTDAEINMNFGFDIGDITVQVPSENGMTCRFSFATKILVDKKAQAKGFKGCTGIVRNQDRPQNQETSDEGLPRNSSIGKKASRRTP